MTVHDHATTWRDLADQLTENQVKRLKSLEDSGFGDESLLVEARDDARMNSNDDLMFGHLPVPGGVVDLDHWVDAGGGLWFRPFTGTVRKVSRATVEIGGEQYAAGSIRRGIRVYTDDDDMTAAEARGLAAALTDAADEIEAAG